jgi:hypothetical protein
MRVAARFFTRHSQKHKYEGYTLTSPSKYVMKGRGFLTSINIEGIKHETTEAKNYQAAVAG